MNKDGLFVVVGLGLMGGSYAMGLAKRGYRVAGIDRDEAALAFGQKNGLIEEGALVGSAEERALLQRADYLLVALYPGGIVPWLQGVRANLKPGLMMTDLAGVKSCFVEEAQGLLLAGQEFVPSHPMAGREVSGVENADDGIFAGANFIITPTDKNTEAGMAFAQALAQTLGFGRVTVLSVEEHDRMIGYVSQLTHAVAVSLMNANDDDRLLAVTGDSFRDLTRIAEINAGLWSELFLANAPALTAEIDDFIASLLGLRACLENEDKAGLQALFEKSTRRHKRLREMDGKQ